MFLGKSSRGRYVEYGKNERTVGEDDNTSCCDPERNKMHSATECYFTLSRCECVTVLFHKTMKQKTPFF